MTRFVNSALIAVFAFFVFLALFWLVAGEGAEPPQQAVQVRDVSPRWGRATADGVEVKLDIGVHNPSISEARVLGVTYEVTMQGQVVAEGTRDTSIRVTPQGFATVQVTAQVPSGIASSWWDNYIGAGEEGEFAVSGVVRGRVGEAVRDIPFEWGSAWETGLADALAEAGETCGPGASGICLEATSAGWQGSDLRLRLSLRNDGSAAYLLENLTARLSLADLPVAQVEEFPALHFQPGDVGSLDLLLPIDRQGLEAWWVEHVRHCEWSSAKLMVAFGVQTETFDGPARQVVVWDLEAAPFLTQQMCHGDA